MVRHNSRKSKKPKSKVKVKVENGEGGGENQAWPWPSRGPCLVIGHGNDPKPKITFYDVSNHRHQSRVSREIANKRLHGCHGDWLLLQDASDGEDCCLLNVVTMEKVELPRLNEEEGYFLNYTRFLLSKNSPTDADCNVFLINDNGFYHHCKIGAQQFTRYDHDQSVLDAVIFQGKIYTIANHCYDLYRAQLQHIVDDSSSPPLQLMEFIPGEKLDALLPDFHGHSYAYLIESCGRLWFVDGLILSPGTVDFQIFQVDFENECWSKVEDIGNDCAVFVDGRRGFSARVTPGSGVKGNCIYFVDDHDKDEYGTMYAYNVLGRSITMLPHLPFQLHAGPVLRWLQQSSQH